MQPNRPVALVRCVIQGYIYGIGLLAMAIYARADSSLLKLDFQCATYFVAAITNNANLEISQVDVVTLPDGADYLLAVGVARNLATSEPGAKAILDTRMVSAAKARKQAATFLKSEVRSKESLTEIKQTDKVSTDQGTTNRVDRLTRIQEDYIIEEAQAVLPQAKIVATWFNEDRSLFYSVLAAPLKRK